MVSKNNQWKKLQQQAEQAPHFGIRKLSVGVASVLLGTTLFFGTSAVVHADTTGGGRATFLATR
ncbi:YSIRK-type signal peptide-containing protein [Limosilactobacillus fastidiosus]|nr:YSIRK-type signal peptide-containing protein [Limosilactobacillus fastidiosus]MCD7086421.1 YSIRK-type signal peptide-containing protein [Limosilactobacillus fastidiosus]